MTQTTRLLTVVGCAITATGLAACQAPPTAPSGLPILPNLAGMTLPGARTAAGIAGFDRLVSHDALQTRSQLVEADWTVCAHDPAPGPADPAQAVDVAVVIVGETCPGALGSAPPATTTTTPPATPRSAVGDPKPRPNPQPNPQPNPRSSSRTTPAPRSETSQREEPTPTRTRSGQSGHPCLPGERDGDGDGFCGEGR